MRRPPDRTGDKYVQRRCGFIYLPDPFFFYHQPHWWLWCGGLVLVRRAGGGGVGDGISSLFSGKKFIGIYIIIKFELCTRCLRKTFRGYFGLFLVSRSNNHAQAQALTHMQAAHPSTPIWHGVWANDAKPQYIQVKIDYRPDMLGGRVTETGAGHG